ncbi:MAG: hypothetical protein OXG92_13150 [Chloroflexi bacterium]|nr:hypothetical protein [Chloroflexota bacterium]MCY3581593.1 hypothetical protein [Chloroflexota bacterium]MCY3717396.1 hypothetical protein [Chloroflexota bacterium]MDE2650042.1 hypothetical protein [Chloroflexota bacterium]MXX83894.1 hypothetical protein [Chloroflexota bacterium]
MLALTLLALALTMVGSVNAQDNNSFLLPSGETQDQCASRLDGDIRISTYADALLWIGQFERECTMPTLGEGETRLEFETSLSLTNSQCRVHYWESGDQDEPTFAVRIHEGNAQVHHRRGLVGDWTKLGNWELVVMKGGDAGDQVDVSTDIIIGGGIHQFEIRTRKGTDKFEILEDWTAFYLIELHC